MSRILLWCLTAVLLAALGTLALPALTRLHDPTAAVPHDVRAYFLNRGVQETGSVNLVSAIYLGYRAYDTLGETIVLVLSVAGVLMVSGAKQ